MAKKKNKKKISEQKSGISVYYVYTVKKNKDGSKFKSRSARLYDHDNKKNISLKKVGERFGIEQDAIKYISQTFPDTFNLILSGFSAKKYDVILDIHTFKSALKVYDNFFLGDERVNNLESFTAKVNNFLSKQAEQLDADGEEKISKSILFGKIRFFIDKTNNSCTFKTDNFELMSSNRGMFRPTNTSTQQAEFIVLGS